MSSRAGLIGLAGLAAAAALGAGVAYGSRTGLVTVALLLGCGALVLGLSHALVRRRERLGSLSRQFRVAIGLAVGVVLAVVGGIAALMLTSSHDVVVIALLVVFAGALAAYDASLFAGAVMADIETLRDALMKVGEGRPVDPVRTTARDELAELAGAANRMVERLAQSEERRDAADEARRDLLAAVSHDLRTPLTSLQLLAAAIEDEVVDDETRARYVRQMSFHIRSLGALIEDLFELSRLEAGDIQWSLEQVRLDELVAEAVEAMRAQAQAKRVDVEATIPPDLAPAEANPEKLQRVLFNLIQNAIHHTPADGSVTVRARTSGSEIEIEVADTGQGIARGDRERVFKPFVRGGDEAARTRSGAGLGLTICRAIVEAHGGRIWLGDSAEGASVRFSLPRAA